MSEDTMKNFLRVNVTAGTASAPTSTDRLSDECYWKTHMGPAEFASLYFGYRRYSTP